MSKFNIARARRAPTSPVVSESVPTGRTHEGAPGYARTVRGELFLLAVSNMVGEDTFYEAAVQRDDRYTALVREATLADPEWTARLLGWLRGSANLRSAALVGAAEFAKARLDAGLPGMSRQVIDSVLLRADEPGELLAYWTAAHGRALPKPVKRGVADAVRRLYDQRSLLKWDSAGRAFRFADVIELTHPSAAPDKPWQGAVYAHALDRRHGNRAVDLPAELTVLRANAALLARPVERRRDLFADRDVARATLREAGMTWESVAGWLQGPLDAAVWEALIPSMGYMAKLRNLRSFDTAGVSDAVAAEVAAELADPERVATSRQLPMRFLSAYRAAPSLRWGHALERALNHSLANVPALPGRTLILVDTSSSMSAPFSRDGATKRWDAAVVFGLALANRCARAEVVSYSSAWGDTPRTRVFEARRREPVLRAVERWQRDGYFLGAATETAAAVREHWAGHDRVVLLTDEQAGDGDVGAALPAKTPLYTWNLAGYRYGHAPSGGAHRHAFGGLTDAGFGMIPLLEAGRDARWPF
ncbi:TROVE domain-containing protein [Nocardia takedensis]|uniref:TROVE domain-containing protein n=1 Tax=Nocardia takedensis TaxID=259390 RepID=UPI0002E3B21B|nr:TROVE domain-containing protein [Nocardia takedensis]